MNNYPNMQNNNTYSNMANNNSLLNNFNMFNMSNPQQIPFHQNQMLNENIHVQNNLHSLIKQQKQLDQTMMSQNNNNNNPAIRDPYAQRNRPQTKNNPNSNKKLNIIEEMMLPQKIVKENADVEPNFISRKNEYKYAKKNPEVIKITNAPYKSIIKDKIISKSVKDIKEADLIVHKVTNIDSDIDIFNTERKAKKINLRKINDEIKVDFHIDNYDKHKKKYDYKETFIRNLAFEAGTCDENKQDYIEFYTKRQKESIAGEELCDNVLHKLLESGLIKPEELPVEDTGESSSRTDLSFTKPVRDASEVIPVIEKPRSVKKESITKSVSNQTSDISKKPTRIPTIKTSSASTMKSVTNIKSKK